MSRMPPAPHSRSLPRDRHPTSCGCGVFTIAEPTRTRLTGSWSTVCRRPPLPQSGAVCLFAQRSLRARAPAERRPFVPPTPQLSSQSASLQLSQDTMDMESHGVRPFQMGCFYVTMSRKVPPRIFISLLHRII